MNFFTATLFDEENLVKLLFFLFFCSDSGSGCPGFFSPDRFGSARFGVYPVRSITITCTHSSGSPYGVLLSPLHSRWKRRLNHPPGVRFGHPYSPTRTHKKLDTLERKATERNWHFNNSRLNSAKTTRTEEKKVFFLPEATPFSLLHSLSLLQFLQQIREKKVPQSNWDASENHNFENSICFLEGRIKR